MVVFGFLDDNPTMSGKRLEGLPVFNTKKFLTTSLFKQHNIDEVVISLADVQLNNKRKIIEYCLENKISIKEVPPYRKWIGGELSTKQIRPVKIEDLLDRGIINLDSKNIQAEVEGKTILVTGGAGSIGSELVKQCLHYNIKRVIAIDQAESALHQLSIDLLNEPFDHNKFELILGNITDVECITKVFKTYKPEIVLHAAAYKHVPLMEMNPAQAIGNNILGTNCLALLCIEHHVKKFVMVSPD
jgi:FlaA1/EpsC-like NDP-sugar epimerase